MKTGHQYWCAVYPVPVAAMMLVGAWASAGGDAKSDKIDDGLASAAGFAPVFVRMEDQVLKGAGDYEVFCRAHEKQPRSQVRRQMIETLRSKCDRSWQQISKKLGELESGAQVKEVTRFWIVNGFACEATAIACKALAEDPTVAFVYRQTGPPQVRQHRAARPSAAPSPAAAEQRAALEQLLRRVSDDSDIP